MPTQALGVCRKGALKSGPVLPPLLSGARGRNAGHRKTSVHTAAPTWLICDPRGSEPLQASCPLAVDPVRPLSANFPWHLGDCVVFVSPEFLSLAVRVPGPSAHQTCSSQHLSPLSESVTSLPAPGLRSTAPLHLMGCCLSHWWMLKTSPRVFRRSPFLLPLPAGHPAPGQPALKLLWPSPLSWASSFLANFRSAPSRSFCFPN